jgi:hypothetical protein
MNRFLMCLAGSALTLGLSVGVSQADSHKGDHPGKGVKKPNENSNAQMRDDATKGQDRAAERRSDKATGNSGKGGRHAGNADGASKTKPEHKGDGGSSLEIDLEPADPPVAESGFFDRMAALFGMQSGSPQ